MIVVGVDHSEGAKAALRFAPTRPSSGKRSTSRLRLATRVCRRSFIRARIPRSATSSTRCARAPTPPGGTLHEIVPTPAQWRSSVGGRRGAVSVLVDDRAKQICSWSDHAVSAASAGCYSAP